MPFCTQCGTQIGEHDMFCFNCGRPQSNAATGAQTASAGFSAPPPDPTRAGFAPPPPPPPPRGAVPPPPYTGKPFMADWEDNKVAALCYIPFVGWVFSIIVLAAERFRRARAVRYHAFQALYLFVGWLMVDWVFGPLARHNPVTSRISELIQLVIVGTGIFLFIKTRQGELVRLPVIGELAEKSVSEQK